MSQRQQDVEKVLNTQSMHSVLILDFFLHGLNYKNATFPKLALFLSLPEDGSSAGFLNMAFLKIWTSVSQNILCAHPFWL
jgi:hypothetical protein